MNRLQRDEPTFKVDFLDSGLIVYVVFLLLIFTLVGEIVVRLNAGRTILGVPSVGSTDRVFESRLSQLDVYAEGRDAIDCVIFGDSTVMTDFAPGPFQNSFQETTGQNIECFNFGVGAFSFVEIASLARIVAEDYSPKIIIIGVEALNFAFPSDDPGGHDFGELAWTQYRLGRFSVNGWLYEHSYLYRHLGSVRQLLTIEKSPSEMIFQTIGLYDTYRDGFFQLESPRDLDVSQPPDPASDHNYHVAYFNYHKNYRLLPEHLTALDQLLTLNNSSTQVVILEMPVPDTFFNYFDNGKQDYNLFINGVKDKVAGTPVPFFITSDLQPIPYNLWHNYNHLTEEGALVFSVWLGEKFGQAALDGTVRFAAGDYE